MRSQLNAINRKQTGRYVRDEIPLYKHGFPISGDLSVLTMQLCHY